MPLAIPEWISNRAQVEPTKNTIRTLSRRFVILSVDYDWTNSPKISGRDSLRTKYSIFRQTKVSGFRRTGSVNFRELVSLCTPNESPITLVVENSDREFIDDKVYSFRRSISRIRGTLRCAKITESGIAKNCGQIF